MTCRNLTWNTPQDKYTNFKLPLKGVAVNAWEVLTTDLDRNDDDDDFNKAVLCSKKKKSLTDTALTTQHYYL